MVYKSFFYLFSNNGEAWIILDWFMFSTSEVHQIRINCRITIIIFIQHFFHFNLFLFHRIWSNACSPVLGCRIERIWLRSNFQCLHAAFRRRFSFAMSFLIILRNIHSLKQLKSWKGALRQLWWITVRIISNGYFFRRIFRITRLVYQISKLLTVAFIWSENQRSQM